MAGCRVLTKFTQLNTPDRVLGQIQDNIARSVNPALAKPVLDSVILNNVSLVSGDNAVSHTLGRKLVGWCVIRLRSAATIYDKQDSNTTPEATLTLNASTGVTVDLLCF